MSHLLDHYLERWGLIMSRKMMETPTGHLYQVDSIHGSSVLKIFTDLGKHDERGGSIFLGALKGDGAALLYEYDDRAQLMEYLPGPNLYEFSQKGQEDKATEIFVGLVKKIRSKKIVASQEQLMTMRDLFKIFDRVSPPRELADLFTKAQKLSKQLVATQTEEILLHGDLHHENVMKNSRGEYVCFDPKGIMGDPAYELATTLKNPMAYQETSQNLEMFKKRAISFSKELNLPLERIVGFAFIHLCLSVGWAIEDGGDYSHQEALLKKVVAFI